MKIILLGLICLAFGRSLGNDFVNWDDGHLIYANENINKPTLEGLAKHWNPKDPSNVAMYDPLVFSTWWMLAHFAQLQYADPSGSALNPQVFHGFNLLIHWLTACVVLEILCRLRLPKWSAFAGAALFAVHPLQTESVAWATALKDLLCGFFVLTAVWRYLIARESYESRAKSAASLPNDDSKSTPDAASTGAALQYASPPAPVQLRGAWSKKERWNFSLATVCYLGALLSKPSGVVAPLLVLVLEVFWNHRKFSRALMQMAPWIAMGLVFIGIAKWVQNTSAIDVAIYDRPLIAADAVTFYLAKFILPMNLCFDYGRDPMTMIKDPAQFHYALYWTWLIPTALALILWRLRQKYLTLAALIFLAGIAPVLGLTTFVFQYFSTVADRYVYVAMLSPAIALAWLISRYPRRAVVAAASAWLGLLIALSLLQTATWQDTLTLYARNFELHSQIKGNWRLLITYGQFRDQQADIALSAGKSFEHQGNLKAEIEQKKIFDAATYEAIEYYKRSLDVEPLDGDVYDYLAEDYLKLGKIDKAIEMHRRELELGDQIPEVLRHDPFYLRLTLGIEYSDASQYPQAIEQLQQALKIKYDAGVAKTLQDIQAKFAATSKPATQPATQ